MTSDSDDLEQQLRENLKLRRELAAEVARANGSSANRGGGIAYRLGQVLYWICFALIGAWVLFFLNVTLWGGEKWGSPYDTILAFILPVAILYGIGRAFRYLLSGE
jgi:hypothetical protein